MLSVLFIAVVILGVLLFDMRARLKKVEAELAEGRARTIRPDTTDADVSPVSPLVRRAAIVIDDPAPSRPQTENTEKIEFSEATVLPHEAVGQSQLVDEVEVGPPQVSTIAPRRAGQRFEDLFGRQLPIWAGGITLAVAGVLLVKYSIDAGLLSPVVRVLLGLLFGAGLIGGAEAALRADARVGDARVRQALSGAGIATLYAAILSAANLYDLVGPATAFVGLAIVTALSLALSIRFGAPSAILGLVGGLAAPALVGEGAPNVPLLSAYLALAIGGLTALSRRQRWMWLGVAALVGGAGWGSVLILTGALDVATSLSLGLLVLLLGVVLPGAAFTGLGAGALRIGAAVIAAAQVALLVAKGGFAPLEWSFYMLLAAALGWLAWREPRFRVLPPVGLTVGLLLLAIWPTPPVWQFALVLLALAVIHVVPAFMRLWRTGGSMIEAGQIVGVALGGYAVTLFHHLLPNGEQDGVLALLALGFAIVPGQAALSGWKRDERRGDARFAALVLASTVLVASAGLIGLAQWLLPLVMAVLGAWLVLLARVAEDRRLENGGTVFLVGSVLALLSTDPTTDEIGRLAGEVGSAPMVQALLRWGVVALAGVIGAMRLTIRSRAPAAAVAAVLVYGAVAQVAPWWSLPVFASLALIGMLEVRRRFAGGAVGPAACSFAAIGLMWAAWPLALWVGPALVSLVGEPMLAGGLPLALDAITRLAIPAVAGLVILLRGDFVPAGRVRSILLALSCLLGIAAVHSLYKQLFDLSDVADVVQLGLAERTVWEFLLLGTGCALWRLRSLTLVGLVCAGAAVAHGLWYSQILHDVLMQPVAVGPWPVVNLLIPAFGLLFAGLWVIERVAPVRRAVVVRTVAIVRMILIVLFAYASLRQLFAGSILVDVPVGVIENIGWSVLAIVLAIGFLLWGIRSGQHDWRIGSLILMLAAVAKVFLMDAAGLEGLLRIASFLALGFSLIGIGWLYSRFLRTGGEAEGQA